MDPEAQTSDVQPEVNDTQQGAVDHGQGAQESGLYDLNSVPEHLRDHVTPILKDIEGNATRRFQQYSDQLKGWEPYKSLGVQEVDPQQLQELLEFHKMAQDPQQFKTWYDQVGQELGYGQQPAQDDLGLDGEDNPEAQLEKMIQERIDQALQPFAQDRQQQQYEQQVMTAQKEIEAELASLSEKHGEFDQDAVLQLALGYGEDKNAVSKAHADYQRIVGAAQSGLVAKKMAQPNTPETGGRPATTMKPVTSFGDAKASAVEMLRAANS